MTEHFTELQDGRIRVEQIIIVEGKYDYAKVSQVVEGSIIAVGGFSVFKDKELKASLREAALSRGVIILTDSDGAGFKIRNYLNNILTGCNVQNAYIPAFKGKERRKNEPSSEGLLGVEGMEGEVIKRALIAAGAKSYTPKGDIKVANLYELGISGGDGSAEKRRILATKLLLPPRMSTKSLIEAINMAMTREEFISFLHMGK